MRSLDRATLADLNIFLTIVRHRSMVKAAVELGVTTSALSHRLRKLEAALAVRLLNRTSRSITPTEAGEGLARELTNGFQMINDALHSLEHHRDLPVGTLRINVPRDAARLVLGPALCTFFATFPDVHLDVTVDDHFVDIVAQGFDAGMRYGNRVPQDMIGVALTRPLEWVVVASPALIERIGLPAHPTDLLHLPCIQMRVGDNSNYPWELGNGPNLLRLPVRGPMTANETEHAVDAAVRGIGFAYCLKRRVTAELEAGLLQLVLPEWASEGAPLTIYYPGRRQTPPGLRQLIDTIRDMERLPKLA
ncbi:LysR family transcriptional regulator [Bradyrhizobium sp. R2.2-H]|uniref:LysR family transcriptional regulator n=1 Tax=unclassified Bradyrhizobium TaxID=2631580 RepID=UPI0010509F8E|nr:MULTISPECIES: LysR family transcriptional regulator [unclassified Bradyrhizobium]TCU72202.1 LysR family transcriptional regulator [Bradyrhizobium sp. Y-H1]TCU74323.1 LysR family transcriptional regulator [Bradyrhizobium sp. R2.2-H]